MQMMTKEKNVIVKYGESQPWFLILGTNLDPFSTFLSTITFQVYSIKQTNKNKQTKIDKYERKLKMI